MCLETSFFIKKLHQIWNKNSVRLKRMLLVLYSVIQKDGLNFVSLCFKIRASDKYDSNDKCASSLEVECRNEDEMHAAQQSPTQF